ncbi:MAG: bifunctional 4-hydroxy-2-oxoglutarate aldolase/2-dehydro-3-deoxy-phosphogluconate aldolase [Sedimentisphaerales bacterium]|jgi:2-dehydro-3-deoxyphosphogluconate aldolase/(4S)-4-hydroxy-2-oxoglutarate aldolase
MKTEQNTLTGGQVYETIRREKIIAILRGVEKDSIISIAEALLAGGIKMLEVTCNTEGVFEMIGLLTEKMGDKMVIGAGTVITTELCEESLEAGAQFIVAPDVNRNLIDYCVRRDIAILPGAATATDILTAKRHGATMVKIFPAAAIGIDYIKALRGPIDDVDFVAVGGVRPETIADFFSAGCIAIGIGDSVVRKEFVENRDWQAITDVARKYVQKLPPI